MKLKVSIGVALLCSISVANAAPPPQLAGLNALVKPLEATLAPLNASLAPVTGQVLLGFAQLTNPGVQQLTSITGPLLGKYDAAYLPVLLSLPGELPGLSGLGL